MRILAIDPSSTVLGWAVLDSMEDDGLKSYGIIKASREKYHNRFNYIVSELNRILAAFKPDEVACEAAIRFEGREIPALVVAVNTIKGWARDHKLPIRLYNPSTWKKSVIGFGGADKEAVARVMYLYFKKLPPDASEHITDAIAIGLHRLGVNKWELLGLIDPR